MYEDLVYALKKCGYPGDVHYCRDCVFANDGGTCHRKKLLPAAADAIEELQGRAKVFEKVADKWCEAVPKWIPVTEALPERGYYVLVYEDGDILMASYADGNWVLRDMYEVIDDLKPTYWMQLPEPPKESE